MTSAVLIGLFLVVLPLMPDSKPVHPTSMVGMVLVSAAWIAIDLRDTIRDRKP